MAFHIKNLKSVGTTLTGLTIMASSIAYIFLVDNHDSIIAFGLLGIGLALCFLPDTLFRGLKSFIEKNKSKEV